MQLDDLDAERLARVRALAFRVVETSPGDYQAGLAVRGTGEEIERGLKEATGADTGANGASRLAGSLNIKEIYRDGCPVVRLKRLSGRVVRLEELQEAGLIREAEQPPVFSLLAREVRPVTRCRIMRSSSVARAEPR